MKKYIFCLILYIYASSLFVNIFAQTSQSSDSLTNGVRKYVARNFSEARTINLYWNTSLSHDYTLKQNGQKIEEGESKDIHTINFSATVPILLLKNASIYANGQYNSYQFDSFNNTDKGASALFTKNEGGYSFYEGSISGNYRFRIGNKPIMLMASLLGDGWDKKFEKVSGVFSAILILKQSNTSNLSVGLYGMTLYDKIPVMPVIAYTHQFTPNLSIDITLPSRTYLRYQFKNSHRLSIGTSMYSEQFYMATDVDGLPQTSYFRKTSIRPEIVYEYIINNHFYLSARGGVSKLIKGGLYNTNRKGIDGDPYIKYTEPVTPFFNLGFSYNIF